MIYKDIKEFRHSTCNENCLEIWQKMENKVCLSTLYDSIIGLYLAILYKNPDFSKKSQILKYLPNNWKSANIYRSEMDIHWGPLHIEKSR